MRLVGFTIGVAISVCASLALSDIHYRNVQTENEILKCWLDRSLTLNEAYFITMQAQFGKLPKDYTREQALSVLEFASNRMVDCR
jgi:hypothetical protein